jgi:hypothetical protein
MVRFVATSILSVMLVLIAQAADDMAIKKFPGYLANIDFEPNDYHLGEETWWVDSDGVHPDIAGCHIGLNEDGSENGRYFGEACLTDDVIVESNPEAGLVHVHHGDVGHPHIFSCARWCAAVRGKVGSCVTIAENITPCTTSARCECE